MLSLDEFITRIKNYSFVKCNDVQERNKCIEFLCELGFNRWMLDFSREQESPGYLYVGVIAGTYIECFRNNTNDVPVISFSDVPISYYNISDEEFVNSLKLLLSV